MGEEPAAAAGGQQATPIPAILPAGPGPAEWALVAALITRLDARISRQEQAAAENAAPTGPAYVAQQPTGPAYVAQQPAQAADNALERLAELLNAPARDKARSGPPGVGQTPYALHEVLCARAARYLPASARESAKSASAPAIAAGWAFKLVVVQRHCPRHLPVALHVFAELSNAMATQAVAWDECEDVVCAALERETNLGGEGYQLEALTRFLVQEVSMVALKKGRGGKQGGASAAASDTQQTANYQRQPGSWQQGVREPRGTRSDAPNRRGEQRGAWMVQLHSSWRSACSRAAGSGGGREAKGELGRRPSRDAACST